MPRAIRLLGALSLWPRFPVAIPSAHSRPSRPSTAAGEGTEGVGRGEAAGRRRWGRAEGQGGREERPRGRSREGEPRRGRAQGADARPQLPFLLSPAPHRLAYNHSSISEIHRLSKERKALWSFKVPFHEASVRVCHCLCSSRGGSRWQRTCRKGDPAFCLLPGEEGAPRLGGGPVLWRSHQGPCSEAKL